MDNQTKCKSVYNPNVDKLKKVLTHPQIYTVLNKQSLSQVNQMIESMERDIKLNKKGEKPEINEEKIRSIGGMLNSLLKIAMEKPITPIFKDLSNELIVLTAYWNENIGQNMKIRDLSYTLRRFIDYHLSMIDLIQLSKSLLSKMEQIQNFSPPSFELSRHYLQSLQDIGTDQTKAEKQPKQKTKVKKTVKKRKK